MRYEMGVYLDPWYDRLNTAYLANMAALGVPIPRGSKDVADERDFLRAMEHHKAVDRGMAAVLSAIKGPSRAASASSASARRLPRPRGRTLGRPGTPDL